MNVIWYDAARGNWDSGLICSIFDKHPDKFIQHNLKELIYPDKSIVIVVGKPEPKPLRDYLENLPKALVILTSDEDSYFDWKNTIPRRHEIWTQYYAPNKEEIKTRILLGAPNRLKDYKLNTHLEKKWLWSFVGQVQNPFRQKCVEVLKGLPDGFLHIVPQFGGGEGGIEYQQYLDIMCQSKYVICPAGSMCVDSFRVYEAMECGAIPITDKRAPRDNESFNYWNEVSLGHTVAYVNDWGILPSYMKNLGDQVDAQVIKNVNYWWEFYKQRLEAKLLEYATN